MTQRTRTAVYRIIILTIYGGSFSDAADSLSLTETARPLKDSVSVKPAASNAPVAHSPTQPPVMLKTLTDTLREYCGRVELTPDDFKNGYSQLNREFAEKTSKKCGRVLYLAFLKKNPRHYEAMQGFAQLLGWSGLYEKAQSVYKKILQAYADDETAQLGMAIVLSWNKQYEASEMLLNTILKRNPDALDAKIHLARVFSWQGKLKQSILLCTEILQKEPDNIYAHKVIGDAYNWGNNKKEAVKHYLAIVNLPQDSSVILDAYFQLADLDWQEGKSFHAIKRLTWLAQFPSQKEQATKKIAAIRKAQSSTVNTTGYRYQEFGFDDSRNAFQFGLAHTSGLVSFEKPLNLFMRLRLDYTIRNEQAENFFATRQPILYDFLVQDLMSAFSYGKETLGKIAATYTPSFYRMKQDSISKLTGKHFASIDRKVFHGAGISGYVVFLQKHRIYYGAFRRPLVIDTSKTTLSNDCGGSLAMLFMLPGTVSITPSAEVSFLGDANGRQVYDLTIAKPDALLHSTTSGKIVCKRYNRQAKGYFSYALWVAGELYLAWEDGFGFSKRQSRFSLPLETAISANLLVPDSLSDYSTDRFKKNIFAGFGLTAAPTYHFSHRHRLSVKLNGYINTDLYLVYYAGINHEITF